MKRTKYTAEQLAFLADGYRSMDIPALTQAFNERFGTDKKVGTIKSTIANHKMTCGRPVGSPKGTSRLFNQEQIQFLRDNYPRMNQQKLTVALNEAFGLKMRVGQVTTFCKNHDIKSSRTGQFKPGHESWNKGTKGLTHGSSTSYKKGHVPASLKPLGHERICSKDGYILIKVAEPNPYTGAATRYRHKHHVVWEAEHGPIPDNHVIAFRDGNKINCDLDNLVLLTRAQNLYLNQNGYADLSPEARPAMLTLAMLATKTFELEREAS